MHGQAEVVDELVSQLGTGTALSLQPVLELVAALASDLQQEAAPHLPRLLTALTAGPLNIRDAAVIKWSLRCLGHLLKILWRPISRDLAGVWQSCSALLARARPDYIRHLSAETLSFLLRKTADKGVFLEEILQFDPVVTDRQAVAKLLFESIKTVNEQFNIHAKKLWPLFTERLCGDLPDLLENICEFSGEHGNQDTVEPLVSGLMAQIPSASPARVDQLVQCLSIFVKLKSGKLISDSARLVSLLETQLELGSPAPLLELARQLLLADKLQLTRSGRERVLELVLGAGQFPLQHRLDLVTELAGRAGQLELPLLRPYLVLAQASLSGPDKLAVLAHMTELVTSLSPPPGLGSHLPSWTPPSLDLVLAPSLRTLPDQEKFSHQLAESVSPSTPSCELSHALAILPALRPLPRPALTSRLTALLDHILDESGAGELACHAPAAMALMFRLTPEPGPTLPRPARIASIYLTNPGEKARLQALNFSLSLSEEAGLEAGQLEPVLSQLQFCLASPDSEVRLLCLESLLVLLPGLGSSVASPHPDCQLSLVGLVESLLAVERCGETLASHKGLCSNIGGKSLFNTDLAIFAKGNFVSLFLRSGKTTCTEIDSVWFVAIDVAGRISRTS